uniref:mitogen-activated protein kinase kinase kinase 1-like isoform X2 n=1 Tax=Fragaria vesca subsp. vesca TaxID=101020 RepID=UPI0005CA189D|nr:PREDICTED: mitogen-activated protein kinase kinase kinase 1-like isoform X2 [Fragaria vesca subsp. vesca]
MHQVETILKAMNPAAKIRKTKLGAVDISPKTWTKGRLLGRGSFGSVYQAYSSDGFVFAAKEVSLLDQESPGRSRVYQLQQEIEFLSWLEHKNIIQYYGSFEYGSNLYMCMEHAPNGSIRRLYQGSNLSYPRVSKYTKEILLGLNYLHGHNVVHRDIKCANILVDAYGSAKLADFGLAKITTKMNELQSLQGTAFWMAPEVLSAKMKNQGYGSPADIWSLGCTVLEMLTRQVPYPGLEPFQAFFKIAMGELPHVPHFLCKEARDFIHQCLQVNPNNRPTAAQLLCHPFVTSGPKKLPHLLDHLDGLFIQMKAKKLYARGYFIAYEYD